MDTIECLGVSFNAGAGVENVLALAARCTNLDSAYVEWRWDKCLDLIFDQK
jgi:hypothetical protein